MARAQAGVRNEPEARRDQVLRVAEALFARAGYRGVGLREIAAQVGIRAPSLFKHFASKDALYNAVLGNIFARLGEVAARLEGTTPFAERLEAFVSGYVDLVASDPHVVPLLFRELMERSEAMDPEMRRGAAEIYRRIDAFIESGQRAGEFRQVDRFRFQIALTGAILYHGLAARPYQAALLDRPAYDRAAWKRTVLDLARSALLAHDAAPPTPATAPRRRR
ncbi:MAG: TetR/AcrR family transcriptional regulator [Candidatus Binatia bacterium]